MAPFSDSVRDQYNRPVLGATVGIYTPAGLAVSLHTASGGALANPMLVDALGNYAFYADDGKYRREIRLGSLLLEASDIIVGDPPEYVGKPGDPGPAGNVAATLDQLKAAPTTNRTMIAAYDGSGSTMTWTTGNFTAQASDRPQDYVQANGTPLTTGAWVRQNANGVAFTYPVAAARSRRWAEVASKQIELSGFTGSDSTGGGDSYAAVQAWLARALERKGEAILDGGFRVTLNGRPAIRVAAPLTIKGAKHITSNTTSLTSHDSGLYFDQDAPESIVVDAGGQLTIDRSVILGPSRVSTYPGIKVVAENSALRLCGGALVQGWQTGIKIENGYYHRIDDASIVDCVTGLQVSAPPAANLPSIYNVTAHKLKFDMSGVTGSTCMAIFNGSQVSASQCSFEGFTGNGIVLVDSTLDLLSSYFEGFGGWNVFLGSYARLNAMGNRVYLNTGANRFVSIEGGGTTGVQIFARGNAFNIPGPTDAQPVDIYVVRNDDPAAVTDIGNDAYLSGAGANVRYLGATFTAGMGPATGRGSHSIRYPGAHPLVQHPISTLPVRMAPAQGPFASPDPAMLMPYGMNAADQDPSGLRSSWGNNPMQMVWHQSNAVPAGQWEKVGVLLPYRAPPTTDLAALNAWAAQLTSDLRAQGVMKNP